MSKPLASGIVARSTGYNIDPRRVIKRAEWNTRFDQGDIAALAASIKTELERNPSDGGLLNAVRVKRITGNAAADFEIVDGERRMTAIWSLLDSGVQFPDGIKATLVDRAQDDVTSLIQMYTANTGKPFLPLEEATAFKRMRDANMTIGAIAAAVGKSAAHVTDTLALLTLDGDLQAAVASGKIGGTAAKNIAIVAKGDVSLQKDLAETASRKDKGAAKALVQKLQDARDAKARAKGKTVKMRALSDEQLATLGTKVAALFASKSREAGWKSDANDIHPDIERCKGDEAAAAAYTLGILVGLRAAAGMKEGGTDALDI